MTDEPMEVVARVLGLGPRTRRDTYYDAVTLAHEVVRLREALSLMSGHDRSGLDHLDEMMRASVERDNAEAEVARLTEVVRGVMVVSRDARISEAESLHRIADVTARALLDGDPDTREASMARHPTSLDPVVYPVDDDERYDLGGGW